MDRDIDRSGDGRLRESWRKAVDMEEEEGTVRVVEGDPIPVEDTPLRVKTDQSESIGGPPPELVVMDEAEEILATILDKSEKCFTEAMVLLQRGSKLFSVVETPKHQNLDRLVKQIIEQVQEHRRLKGGG